MERVGDLESFAALLHQLRAAGVDFGHRLIVSRRTLGVAFSPKFEAVGYYL